MKKSKIIISLIVLLCIVSNTYCQQRRRPKAESFKDLNEAKAYLKKQANENLYSGTVLVKSKDKTFIEEAYGMANKEKNIPNKIDTKINIGSINKVFTSVCVMQLVEQGKIKLEDKIVQYVPELKMPMAEEITILHLLSMKSGLGSYWDSGLFQKSLKKLNNLEDYLPIIAEYKLNSKPGTKRQYSNSGYELLGILVQRVSGQNYYDYVKENVYKKAGMQNTDAFPRNKNTPNLAQGYSNYTEGEELNLNSTKSGLYDNNVNDWYAIKGTSAGGGYSTLDDLYKFLVALNDNKLLSEKSTDMVVNRFRDFPKRKAIYHFRGGGQGINAVISYNSKKEIAVIVLSNYDPPTASNIANRLIETVNLM